MKKISLLILIMCLSIISEINAQQLSSYKMYHLNPYLRNPAAAGTTPYIFVSTASSQNWSGIEGAPSLKSVSAHSLIAERAAFGGKVFYDNSGLSAQFGAEASYAYHLPINASGTKLSMGVSAILSQYSLHKDKFVLADPDDEVVVNAAASIIVPDAAFGISLYHPNKFYVNIASYQLLDRQVNYLNGDYLENKQVRHYFVGGAYRFTINENLKIEPSALVKFNESMFYQADVGIKVELQELISVGCYYSTNDAIIPYVGIDTKYLIIGYTYGYLLGDIGNYSVGSHEIMLILKLNNAKTSL
ncbi:MAG: PorP/SprF family type IX secretion system membrane protein [Flavobacteriales bacterium]|nr:PorP/SprF family type IX secretion system membrane protein [Flavobacteriales bacterium]